jgi:hypothetical protein
LGGEKGAAPDSVATEIEGQKIVASDTRDCVSLKPSSPKDQALCAVFLQNAIRSAVLRARLDANELTSIALALSNGWISAAGAIEWLADIGLVDQVTAAVGIPTTEAL